MLKGLTKAQQEAVTHNAGPILVVAGAGTGKTTVITRRIAWLIQEKKVAPESILALTFTEKAASEMLSRVDDLSDHIYSGLSISTFHSFGADIISEFGFELGLPADTRVLTDIEQILFIRDHLFEFELSHYQNLADPTSLIRELVKVFSRAKDENISPAGYCDFCESKLKELEKKKKIDPVSYIAEKEEAEKELEIAKAYTTYDRLLKAEGYIDYGDQIMLVLKLLKKPSIRKKLQERYRYALVDEFQDTNFVQNKLVLELFGAGGNVMVVGDDDQSIYKFRGAAVSNILDFKEDYSDPKTIVLKDNFRSTQPILDTSYRLIKNNNPERLEAKYGIDKKLVSHLPGGKEPELMLFETESQEAEAVAQKILDLKNDGQDFSEMAVLFRGNRQAEEFVRALKKHGIPFVYSGAAGLYEKQEVKMLCALVTALSDPEDDLAYYHLASSDVYNLNGDDLAKISRWSKERNIPLSRTFGNLEPIAASLDLSPKALKLAEKMSTDISALREEAKGSTAGEVVNYFLRESGYYAKLTREAKEGSMEAHNRISNIASFFDKIIHFQRNYKDHSLEKFARYLELLLDAGDDPKPFEAAEGLDAVSVLTVHKSKGLEFETVFVSSLSDSHLPGRARSEKLSLPQGLGKEKETGQNPHLAEERRLFYVALTRAKKNLFLTAALDYGTKKTHKISRFILEALGETQIEKRFLKTEPIERIKQFEKLPILYDFKLEPIPEEERIVLSRAAIDDWLTCPFKYQLIHVTPIRIVADSTVAYGNAIHNAIGEYYKRRMNGVNVKKDELLAWFDLFWDESGFLSKAHERKRYEHGKKALSDFYRKAEQEPLPKAIEREFKIALGNTIIKGRYDAIFETPLGAEIVDFKTSNVKTQKEADTRTVKSKQLGAYALSWILNEKKMPAKVKLYFVESGVIGEFEPTEKSIEKTKEEMRTAIAGIRARNFEATPDLMSCRYCPFKFYCPVGMLDKVAS